MEGAELIWAVDPRHMARARAQYRCGMTVHTASTLAVNYRLHSELELGYTTGDDIAIGFGSKFRTTILIYFYFVGSFFTVGASTVPLTLAFLSWYQLITKNNGPDCGLV